MMTDNIYETLPGPENVIFLDNSYNKAWRPPPLPPRTIFHGIWVSFKHSIKLTNGQSLRLWSVREKEKGYQVIGQR